jgi:hypothetical protein
VKACSVSEHLLSFLLLHAALSLWAVVAIYAPAQALTTVVKVLGHLTDICDVGEESLSNG